MMKDKIKSSFSGYIPLILALLGLIYLFAGAFMVSHSAFLGAALMLYPLIAVLFVPFVIITLPGLYTIQPNQVVVLTLFGKYIGTVRDNGLRWNNPLFGKRKISIRTRNFQTDHLKVNDLNGSPIEIAAVIVWQVVDAAQAIFNIDDYENYLRTQAEAALRTIASHYPYDGKDGETSLRQQSEEISETLKTQLDERLHEAGIRIIDARFSHLAYAPEIAQSMLQRQQAGAIVAARRQIVEGAIGMVEDAISTLEAKSIVKLSDDRKAIIIGNLLTVLCSDRPSQPVINATTN